MASDRGTDRAASHWLARLDDAWHAWRAQRGRRRGWVPIVVPYLGYGNGEWVRVLGRVILVAPDAPPFDPQATSRGWRNFVSISVNGAEVEVLVDDAAITIHSDRGGVIDSVIRMRSEPGWRTVRLRVGDREIEAPVSVSEASTGFGIVSDVDDTVMVTALPRPLLAAWNTFVLDEKARRPVAGMAVLYTRVLHAHSGAPMIYLSTGAWNVAPTLTRFLERNLYPRGALLLTDWGPTRDRWFRSGPEHKAMNLERLAAEFPRAKWLLVGDDGQHDEQIYGAFAEAHPHNVAAVAIRRLTPGQAVLAGGRSAADTHAGGIPWVYADDGAGLMARLDELGLLATGSP